MTVTSIACSNSNCATISSSSRRLAGLALCPCDTTTVTFLAMDSPAVWQGANSLDECCPGRRQDQLSFICPLIVRSAIFQLASRCTRYSSADKSDTPSVSISNSHPSPYVSTLMPDGSESKRGLNLVKRPVAGAYSSLSAFELSIEPMACFSLTLVP